MGTQNPVKNINRNLEPLNGFCIQTYGTIMVSRDLVLTEECLRKLCKTYSTSNPRLVFL